MPAYRGMDKSTAMSTHSWLKLSAIIRHLMRVPRHQRCKLIGKTVQVLREGACWVIRHGGQEVARHEVLAGKVRLSVQAEHGPRAQKADGIGAWGEVFGDRVIATAILDRLLHHAVTLNIRGNSYRLKEKLKAGLVRSDESDP